ncbi:MAG: type II secretion system protein J [Phycisphaerales bacterium]
MKLVQTRKAFTLAELVVALGITSTVMIGTVAAIGIGGRTFQVATTGIGSSEANDGLARMSADIEQAIHFDERTATAIAFYVPDRTGDGTPDHLRYAWSGTPGDSITLSFNGSDAAPVIEGVETVSFEYVYSEVAGTPSWASAAVEYTIFDDPYSGSHTAFIELELDDAVAAIVEPAAPAGASQYAIVRVEVAVLDAAFAGDDVTVSIHGVDRVRATPLEPELASGTILHEDLPDSYTMVAVEFENPPVFSDGDFVAIVMRSSRGGESAYVPLEDSPEFLANGWVAAGDYPDTWTLYGALDMPVVIYAIEVE